MLREEKKLSPFSHNPPPQPRLSTQNITWMETLRRWEEYCTPPLEKKWCPCLGSGVSREEGRGSNQYGWKEHFKLSLQSSRTLFNYLCTCSSLLRCTKCQANLPCLGYNFFVRMMLKSWSRPVCSSIMRIKQRRYKVQTSCVCSSTLLLKKKSASPRRLLRVEEDGLLLIRSIIPWRTRSCFWKTKDRHTCKQFLSTSQKKRRWIRTA